MKSNPNVIVGFERYEDAGVYRLSEDLFLVQTVDFFTPIVDNPRTFGRIAVANALSDIYAMGATPITALNIVAFPIRKMSHRILREILKGGLEKLEEAGVALLGGHSVEDSEIKYGLAVTGIAKRNELIFNQGARVGDCLVLTKPIGTGIISTASKAGEAPKRALREAIKWMQMLNAGASRAMKKAKVHAATDVTGFGLIGHLAEMLSYSGLGARIYVDRLPLLPDTFELAKEGFVPGGMIRNLEFRETLLVYSDKLDKTWLEVLCDPQTSGGLLIAVSPKNKNSLLSKLREERAQGWEIGSVIDGGKIVIESSRIK